MQTRRKSLKAERREHWAVVILWVLLPLVYGQVRTSWVIDRLPLALFALLQVALTVWLLVSDARVARSDARDGMGEETGGDVPEMETRRKTADELTRRFRIVGAAALLFMVLSNLVPMYLETRETPEPAWMMPLPVEIWGVMVVAWFIYMMVSGLRISNTRVVDELESRIKGEASTFCYKLVLVFVALYDPAAERWSLPPFHLQYLFFGMVFLQTITTSVVRRRYT